MDKPSSERSRELVEFCQEFGITPEKCPAPTVHELTEILTKTQSLDSALALVEEAMRRTARTDHVERQIQALHEFAAQSYFARSNVILAVSAAKVAHDQGRSVVPWKLYTAQFGLPGDPAFRAFHTADLQKLRSASSNGT